MFQHGSAYVRPLARFLKVVAQGCSIGLQEAIVDFGAEDSFALAAERVLLSFCGLKCTTFLHFKTYHPEEMFFVYSDVWFCRA